MLSYEGILQTLSMIDNQKLDIRTITMGISLMDCADSDGEKARQKIYNKIVEKAGHLVEVGQAIEKEFGIPIINKRISVTPISIVAGASADKDYVKFAEVLDRAARDVGVNFI